MRIKERGSKEAITGKENKEKGERGTRVEGHNVLCYEGCELGHLGAAGPHLSLFFIRVNILSGSHSSPSTK